MGIAARFEMVWGRVSLRGGLSESQNGREIAKGHVSNRDVVIR